MLQTLPTGTFFMKQEVIITQTFVRVDSQPSPPMMPPKLLKKPSISCENLLKLLPGPELNRQESGDNIDGESPRNIPALPNHPMLFRTRSNWRSFLNLPDLLEKDKNDSSPLSNETADSLNGPPKMDFPFKYADHHASHPWRHLIYSPKINSARFKKYLDVIWKGICYAVRALKSPSEKFLGTKQINLAAKAPEKNKKTLFMDLDETLIHFCKEPGSVPDVVFDVKDENGKSVTVGIKVRPWAREFIRYISDFYEVIIFTASAHFYAKAVAEYLDPTGRIITDILSRNNCMQTKTGFFIKDLRILKNRDLANVVLVDNLSYSFGFQIDNGVPILEWIDDKDDDELKYLYRYLEAASKAHDIREFNRTHIGLTKLATCPDSELVVPLIIV